MWYLFLVKQSRAVIISCLCLPNEVITEICMPSTTVPATTRRHAYITTRSRHQLHIWTLLQEFISFMIVARVLSLACRSIVDIAPCIPPFLSTGRGGFHPFEGLYSFLGASPATLGSAWSALLPPPLAPRPSRAMSC